MEGDRRFSGQSYPQGMCAFPFHLVGQGFFPGGDGLWREDFHLNASSNGALPVGGLMFVGNDFGTLASYEGLRHRGYENPLTWQNVKARVLGAHIPPGKCFFTNAILGLRTGKDALAKMDWEAIPGFADFCREFLIYQLNTLRPRLTVVMGPNARTSFEALGADSRDCGRVLYASHPYADLRWPDTRDRAVRELAAAWSSVSAEEDAPAY